MAAVAALLGAGLGASPAHAAEAKMPTLQDLMAQLGTVDEVSAPPQRDEPRTDESTPSDTVWDPAGPAGDGESSVLRDGAKIASRSGSSATAQTAAQAGASAASVGSHLGALPQYSFETIAATPLVTIRVELATGNLLVTEHDDALNAGGQALSIDRYYNSQTTRMGVLRGGWMLGLGTDVGLTGASPTSSLVTFYGPSGFVATFTPKSGATNTWVGAAGFDAVLTRQPGATNVPETYTVTYNQSGEKWVFDNNGWQIQHLNRNSAGVDSRYTGGGLDHVNSPWGSDLFWFLYDPNYFGYGRLAEINRESDAKGTEYEADASGRLTRVLYPSYVTNTYTDPDSAHSYTYVGSSNRIATIALPSDNGSGQKTYGITYDPDGRVSGITLQAPGASTASTLRGFAYTTSTTTVTDGRGKPSTYNFDGQGRAISYRDQLNRTHSTTWTTTNKVASSTDALSTPNTTTYSYDTLGNPTGQQLPTGAASQAIYAQGTNCPQAPTGTSYQVQCSVSADGNKRSYDYDTTGNLLKVRDTTSSTPGTTRFAYTYTGCGGLGQPCTAKDGNGNLTTYEYAWAGLVSKVTPPAPLGATTYTYDGRGGHWLSSVTDGNGDKTSYVYNARGNTLGVSYQDGGSTAYTYSKDGLVLSETSVISDGGSGYYQTALTHTYDEQGREASRVTTTTHGSATTSHTETLTYDGNGNILTFVVNGDTTTYTYDDANEMTSFKLPGGTCPTGSSAPAASSNCVTFAYDANGHEVRRTFPGGAYQDTTHDASGRVTRVTAKDSGSSTVVDVGYTFNFGTQDRLQIQTRTSFKEQGVPAGAVTAYSYDTANRLLSAVEKSGSTTNASWTYAYDAAGNRTAQTRAGNTGSAAGSKTYTYNAANQLTAATGDTTSWAYDAAGQQTKNGQTNATTQYGDRLQVTSLTGQPVQTAGAGNTNTLAIGGSSFTNTPLGLSVTTTSGSTSRIGRGGDGAPISTKIGSNTKFYIRDHLGSVIGLLSATGSYEGGYSYSPYGESRFTGASGAVTTNLERYIGGHLDPTSGLYKLGARYYDSSLGRFAQMDPSGQEKNPYAYASCNPISSSDPSGLVGCLAQTWDVLWNTTGFILGSMTIVGAVWAVPGYIGWNQSLYDSGQIDEDGYLICEMEWDPSWPLG